MQNVRTKFEFTAFKMSQDRKSISFLYAMYNNQDKEIFEEKLLLPIPIPFSIPELLLNNFLFSLHLVLGISFYKMYCPKEIVIISGQLSNVQADFWNTVYTKGLGEFFYRNKIDFRSLVHFPYNEDKKSSPVRFERSNRSLLGIGGGKDSLVSYKLLQKANKSFTPLVVESNHPYPLIERLLRYLNIPSIKIKRSIDGKVFEKNKTGTVFNGHIPISAINAFVGIFTCLIYDYRYFIVSNERSANFGNVDYLGMQVNHQWSKSREFEDLFQTYVRQFITPSISYFSLLRPLSELAIVKLFCSYDEYFSLFSSCNTNYKVETGKPKKKWCNACPKCAFIFSVLSAYLPKNTIIEIFDENLFADKSMSTIFRQLWGVQDMKPFECVGTPEEVIIAFYLSYKKGEYKNDVIMRIFEKEILPLIHDSDDLLKAVLKIDNTMSLPSEFSPIISQLSI